MLTVGVGLMHAEEAKCNSDGQDAAKCIGSRVSPRPEVVASWVGLAHGDEDVECRLRVG